MDCPAPTGIQAEDPIIAELLKPPGYATGREYAYDRQSHVGKLDRALSEAPGRGWVVVDMKRDWKTVFPASAGGPP